MGEIKVGTEIILCRKKGFYPRQGCYVEYICRDDKFLSFRYTKKSMKCLLEIPIENINDKSKLIRILGHKYDLEFLNGKIKLKKR
ncbi:MAG: hypothetical protein ABIB79_04670 [archaeon]